MQKLSRRSTMKNRNLPDDVLLKIFVELPAKQLAQMRCMSKSWNAHLSESDFVKSHLRRSIRNNDDILLIFTDDFSLNINSKPFTAHLCRTPHLELPKFIKLPVKTHPKKGYGNVIGSINGLICFKYGYKYTAFYYIWNPSLSALITLPPYSIPSHYTNSMDSYFQFGFDPKTDDYKVVKLTKDSNKWLPVEVYSMRKGTWKVITQKIPPYFSKIFGDIEVCVDLLNGHMRWLGYTDMKEGRKLEMILAFDLNAETFSEIPFPDCIRENGLEVHYRTNVLRVLNGKLCVISTMYEGHTEVWVMNEYGVGDSWVKLHVFPPFSGDIDPYGFTSRNEFLFRFYPYDFLLYDPIAETTKMFKSRGEAYAKRKVVEYVDSLVWVTPAEMRHIIPPPTCLRM